MPRQSHPDKSLNSQYSQTLILTNLRLLDPAEATTNEGLYPDSHLFISTFDVLIFDFEYKIGLILDAEPLSILELVLRNLWRDINPVILLSPFLEFNLPLLFAQFLLQPFQLSLLFIYLQAIDYSQSLLVVCFQVLGLLDDRAQVQIH